MLRKCYNSYIFQAKVKNILQSVFYYKLLNSDDLKCTFQVSRDGAIVSNSIVITGRSPSLTTSFCLPFLKALEGKGITC